MIQLALDFYLPCDKVAVLYTDDRLFYNFQCANEMLFLGSCEVNLAESAFAYRHTNFEVAQSPLFRVKHFFRLAIFCAEGFFQIG